MEEDKKRTLDSTSITEEPQKKKPLLSNDHERKLSNEPLGPLTIEDIVDFQKEAIFRQMKVYKREKDLFEDKVIRLEKQYNGLESSFLLLDEWWTQLIETVFPGEDNNESEIVSLLQFTLEDSFKKSLESKNRIIKSRISSWLNSHPSKSSDESELRKSLAKVNRSVGEIKIQNESLLLSNNRLKTEVDKLTERYLNAEKKLDRLQSPSLVRVQSEIVKSEEVTESPDSDNKVDSTQSTNNSPETLVELEKLKIEFENSQAIVSKQSDHIKEFQLKISSLNEQITTLNSRLISLTSADLEKSDVYKTLLLKNENLTKQVETLTSINEKLSNDKSSLQINQDQFENKLRNEYNDKNTSLQQQILKAEQDVARIRSARDELLSELNIKKAGESDRKRSFEELKSLVAIRETRIKTLEEEIIRLKDETKSTDSLAVDGTNDSEKLQNLLKITEKLQRQNKSLLAELPGLEQAFAQAHKKASDKIFNQIDQEAILNKLKAEKVRADEKYFSAMRSKDQLSNENNRLKSQLSKSAELIQQLKDLENSKTQTITSLRKQLDDGNKSQESITRELQSIKLSLNEKQYRIDSCSRHIDQLKEDNRLKSDSIQKEIDSRHSLEIEIEKLKRQVDAKRLTSIGGNSSAVEEQVEALRSIAICSVCSKNWKDTAIKVCGHVFCNDCAKDRLNARLRKCPMCNKQYSFNDLLPVHL